MHSWEGNPRQLASPDLPPPDYAKTGQQDRSIDPEAGGWRILLAVVVGVLLAVPFATPTARGALAWVAQWLTPREATSTVRNSMISAQEVERFNHLAPQGQAEFLLQSAVSRRTGSTEQIMKRAEGWHGKLQLNPKLNSLLTAAFDNDDLQVRSAAVEVDLAALNLPKIAATVDRLEKKATSGPQSDRVWALWELGLLGSRGVESERIDQMLVSQLQDPNPEVRHWAVEGLAYVAKDEAIEPLLKTMHDDASPTVRERAACGLAQSGMFSKEQRRSTVPKLLEYADDASLDAQTHAWTFHALRDISGQNLPDDAAAWRDWYSRSSGN